MARGGGGGGRGRRENNNHDEQEDKDAAAHLLYMGEVTPSSDGGPHPVAAPS